MAREVTSYDIFISSPSDVELERDIVQEAVDLVSQINGVKEGYILNPIRWETNVSSQIGDEPQNVINDQIGDEYDIFIGVLCSRFGQKTAEYESGTEEEFFKAYERRNSSMTPPEIMFYFKDPRNSESEIDAEQLVKVSQFKSNLKKLGIYEEFATPESLKTLLLKSIPKAIDRLKTSRQRADRNDDVDTKPSSNVNVSNALLIVSDFDEDIGIFELIEMTEEANDSFASLLGTIADATEKLNSKLTTHTSKIVDLKSTADTREGRQNVKTVLERVAAEMQRYSHKLDDTTPRAEVEFGTALRCMQHAIIISRQDGLSSENDINDFVASLRSLQSAINAGQEKLRDFRDSISSLQRMTSKLNQSKRRTIKSVDNFLVFLRDSSTNIDTVLDSI